MGMLHEVPLEVKCVLRGGSHISMLDALEGIIDGAQRAAALDVQVTFERHMAAVPLLTIVNALIWLEVSANGMFNWFFWNLQQTLSYPFYPHWSVWLKYPC